MNSFEKHPQWKDVLSICTLLKSRGFTAWLAGGCVRDYLMGVAPQDFDVVTDAVPDEVQKLFHKSIDVGKSFGIIMVPFENFRVEIATFRSDGNYLDGRRPDSVVFSTPQEDAERRDFTVNALFLDPFTWTVHDFVEGQRDIRARILRAVGDAKKRFAEDKLRMLRAVRFSSQLDFEIEHQTRSAIQEMAVEIKVISHERIQYELKRMFETPRTGRGLRELEQLGLLPEILKPIYEKSLVIKSIELVEFAEQMPAVNFSVEEKFLLFWLTFLIGKDQPVGTVKLFLKDLKFGQNSIGLYNYVTDAMLKIANEELSKSDQYQMIFHDQGKSLLKVGRLYWQNSPHKNKLENIAKLLNDFPKLPAPLVNGEDLKILGVKPSPQMKEILKRAYDHQLENKITSKAELLLWTKDLIS